MENFLEDPNDFMEFKLIDYFDKFSYLANNIVLDKLSDILYVFNIKTPIELFSLKFKNGSDNEKFIFEKCLLSLLFDELKTFKRISELMIS